jgi:hypothetical protein
MRSIDGTTCFALVQLVTPAKAGVSLLVRHSAALNSEAGHP